MTYYFSLAFVLFIYMSLWFIVSLLKKRNDVADVAWGLGFVLMALGSFLLSENYTFRGIMIGILVGIWGIRLAWHIYSRNRRKTEDYRYLNWRKEWGKWFYVRSYFQVFLLQGLLLFCIATPIFIINKNGGAGVSFFDFIGVGVWIIGFLFEAIGDFQLARFIKNPENKGKIMQSGLWGYTRHPNYFGEVTQWWGIWLSALSVQQGWIAIIGPLTITFLILKVSGIPMLEKKMAENPQFEEYKKRVSVFLPLPPRKNSRDKIAEKKN